MKSGVFTALGIDVGGTKIAAGVVEFPSGRVLVRRQIPTRPERGGSALLKEVRSLARQLTRDLQLDTPPPLALGIGLCELVSPVGQILSHHTLSWETSDILEHLGDLAPVTVEADVRAAAQAEACFGAGRHLRSFLHLTIGTGIASCLMVEGRPHLGARGATGTLASSPVTLPCECCGNLTGRTLEQLASGPGMVARYNAAGSGRALSAEDVVEAARMGDPTARHVVETAGESLGSALAMLINVLDPEAVSIGGGLGLSEGPFWTALVSATRRHTWSDVHRNLPILRAQTGANAGLIGAAIAATAVRPPPN